MTSLEILLALLMMAGWWLAVTEFRAGLAVTRKLKVADGAGMKLVEENDVLRANLTEAADLVRDMAEHIKQLKTRLDVSDADRERMRAQLTERHCGHDAADEVLYRIGAMVKDYIKDRTTEGTEHACADSAGIGTAAD